MLRTALQSTRQCSQRLLTTHKDAPLLNLEHVRTTVIMEQMFPPKLARKGALPKVTQKNRVLNFVDRVHAHKTPDITCILTDFVEGVGIRGDTVTVKRRLFRGKLFPAGQAVYATDENVEKFTREKQGVEVKESCITLPQEAITGPEEFNFRITVNGVKSVMVKGRVVLRHNDPSKDERIELPPTWLPTTKIKKTKQSAESLGDS
ncbi:large ribosomal subunit protein bL9m-like isoform X3 [Littorina saxatilis]|uniref:large ribosomal subunit protein bL9m-like isoform X3 n=1 Tax=Littorina saxatilis TaxID=31220 RepID=UPI0038B68357